MEATPRVMTSRGLLDLRERQWQRRLESVSLAAEALDAIRPEFREQALQSGGVDVLDRHPRRLGLRVCRHQRSSVLTVDGAGGLDLAPEAVDEASVAGQRIANDFDRDQLAGRGLPQVHMPHTAAAEPPEHAEWPDLGALSDLAIRHDFPRVTPEALAKSCAVSN